MNRSPGRRSGSHAGAVAPRRATREPSVCERRNGAARRRQDHAQPHVADGELAPRPVILRKRQAAGRVEHQIGSVANGLGAHVSERRRGDNVHRGVVDEGVSDVPSPISSSASGPRLDAGSMTSSGAGRSTAARAGAPRSIGRTLQQRRELVGGAGGGDRVAVGHGDREHAVVPPGADREESAPEPRVLRARDEPGGGVDQRRTRSRRSHSS